MGEGDERGQWGRNVLNSVYMYMKLPKNLKHTHYFLDIQVLHGHHRAFLPQFKTVRSQQRQTLADPQSHPSRKDLEEFGMPLAQIPI